MGKPLRVLLVEDVETVALLVVRELKRGGFDVAFERVDTAETMSAALGRQSWDLIIADYSLPHFSAPGALKLIKERQLDLPFIVVSGAVGEHVAVDAMRAGAHNFIIKGQFARLIPAIEHEVREAAARVEQTKMREQLLLSDRMVSIGTLAAGVAHEINNPLAALMANLDFVTEDVAKLVKDTSEPGTNAELARRLRDLEEPLRDASQSADRVRLIVRDLKIFSRSDEETQCAVDVRRVMESSLRMAWNEIRHRARLVKDYGNVPAVLGNEARLGQVFLNIVVNAAQAMPEGRADKNEIRVVTKLDDQSRVVVEIRDTGCGIPASILGRIFDPFFTTKPIGVGTGLGLAICHRIVTALGGKLFVESKVDVGSVFRIVLPVATYDRVEPPPRPAPAPMGRRGRILVVDDEPTIGAAVQRILSSEHEVIPLTSAQEVIGRVSRGERFDVILCDLMMPDVTGMDLHAELSQIAPAQADNLVFMTGGAFSVRAREFLDRVRNPRVDKPFDAGVLRSIVHGLLR